jgi:hypothetical protein
LGISEKYQETGTNIYPQNILIIAQTITSFYFSIDGKFYSFCKKISPSII